MPVWLLWLLHGMLALDNHERPLGYSWRETKMFRPYAYLAPLVS